MTTLGSIPVLISLNRTEKENLYVKTSLPGTQAADLSAGGRRSPSVQLLSTLLSSSTRTTYLSGSISERSITSETPEILFRMAQHAHHVAEPAVTRKHRLCNSGDRAIS